MLYPIRAALAALSFLALAPQTKLLAQRTDSAQIEFQHVISHFPDDPATDAFGLRRSANRVTIHDSKFIGADLKPNQWDDVELSGSGTATIVTVNENAVKMSISSGTPGVRIRQTFERFNFRVCKSMMVQMIFMLAPIDDDLIQRAGYFDDSSGAFFNLEGPTANFSRRSSTTGSPVDTDFPQSEWNIDRLDGNDGEFNRSGILLDLDKIQILVIDFQGIGVGRTRFGFDFNGTIVYAHEISHTNQADSEFLSSPNLPLRFSITNLGGAASSVLRQIASTVIVEGGSDELGEDFQVTTAENILMTGMSGVPVAMIVVRLQSDRLDASVAINRAAILPTGNASIAFALVVDPIISGTLVFSDVANSPLERALGDDTNIVTGGVILPGGFARSSKADRTFEGKRLRLGSFIDGTPRSIALVVTPLTNNATVVGALDVRHFD